MTAPTITQLITTLAAALGVEPELVKGHAHALREAGLFPSRAPLSPGFVLEGVQPPEKDQSTSDFIDKADTGDAQAKPEHAAAILISLMAAASPGDATGALRLFGELPVECVHGGISQPDGHFVSCIFQDDNPCVGHVKAWLGDTFGESLVTLIEWFNEASEVDFEVINFVLGGGPGTSSAIIYFAQLIEGATVLGDVKFSFNADDRIHDGPRCRLERHATVPGAILQTFREFFTGAPGGPREIFVSRADLERLSEGGLQ